MHPREGWTEEGRKPGLSRRSFLMQGAGAGLMLGSVGTLLEACGSSSGSPASGSGTALPLPRPRNPVTWPIYKGNAAIKSSLAPEKGATLKIYNWVAYINQKCLNDFAKKYNCKVEVTTFNTMDEALAKIHSGQVNFDVFLGVTIDVLGPLIAQKFIQPINHSYIPNISQAWSDYRNPFYDGKWQYTVPYTIYTTGIAWRKDHVPGSPATMANPWSFLWQPKYKGKVAILDDYREGISLGLMKNGIYNLNTTNPSQIAASGQALQNLSSLTNMQINNNDYTQIPSGQIWIHHAWSGDIASSASYMAKGVNVDVVGYWFPANGRGPVGNDLITILRTARNPVLAHLFMNYMLDLPNVLTNISFNGYMQPIAGVTPQRLVSEQILPPSLMSTVVLPSYFRKGVMELQIPTSTNLLWEQSWQAASKGL
ncbi:MAG TPA: spermidine/putrescine ABC transporter substrate-binding protein [Streptosporangiaceae bacterium]|jgi:spermidine/putrescine transport system substrate-binding protein|nr:spermidine/putrescine ABC transporter substrate-binding protein [Streptosporangiaceae bacterium]